MRAASARLLRLGLAFGSVLGAYVASPLSQWVPVASVGAAEDNGLGAGGASLAYNYVLVVAIVLAFIFGYAVRDVLHRRAVRSRSAKKPTPTPPRA